MLSVERFLQLIDKGEGSQIEFKVSLPSKVRELAEVIRFCYLLNVGVESENVGVESENVGVDSDVKLSKRQLDLIEIISRDGKVTAKNMSEILSVTLRTLERDFSYLQKNGFVGREGSDRYGSWIVLKKNRTT